MTANEYIKEAEQVLDTTGKATSDVTLRCLLSLATIKALLAIAQAIMELRTPPNSRDRGAL